MKARLMLPEINIQVHLGVPESERATPQTIQVSVCCQFDPLPKGCETDHIDDTLCYATLCESLTALAKKKAYHLIEHLGFTLYQHLEKRYTSFGTWGLRVQKSPPLEGCTHSQFIIGEWP